MTDILFEEDGLSLLEHLHAVSPKLPVIVMTAHSDLDSVASYSKGALNTCQTFDVDDAILLVRRALERQKEAAYWRREGWRRKSIDSW